MQTCERVLSTVSPGLGAKIRQNAIDLMNHAGPQQVVMKNSRDDAPPPLCNKTKTWLSANARLMSLTGTAV